MIKKVLIANRGECALAILRSAKELGIKTVAVYTEVDFKEPIVYLADEAICVGKNFSKDSYLNTEALITTAIQMGCDAIHPGYGFLSENFNFAKSVEKNGLIFIGPPSDVIKAMSDKLIAKNLMNELSIPTVAGSNIKGLCDEEIKLICRKIGYPILIKSRFGGGGKGMRRVDDENKLLELIELTRKEAQNSFGNNEVFVEKFIENPRHIEVQILSDGKNVIHLFERECSLQKNSQKIIEEAPCYFISKTLKEKLYDASIKIAKASNYVGAGTCEFLVDKDENFYFMEMNTRLQVEHAVTEAITGIDIIKEQFRVASNLGISFKQEDVKIDGHSIEVRVNATNPLKDFIPSSGEITFLLTPSGMDTRFESSIYKGSEISVFYDSMIAKIIVKDSTRLNAIKKMRRAIEETIIEGIDTNLGFLYAILFNKDFLRGNIDTSFIEKNQNLIIKEIEEVSNNFGTWSK